MQPSLLSVKKIYYLKLQLDKQQLSLPPHWVSIVTSRHQLKICKIDENHDISYCLTVAGNDLAKNGKFVNMQGKFSLTL